MNRLLAIGFRLLALGALTACSPRIDPQFSPGPRLEATIESLSDELTRLRAERDSLAGATDSLRIEVERVQRELQRIKDIDLRRKAPRPRL